MSRISDAALMLALALSASPSAVRAQQDLWARLNARAMDLHRQKRDAEAGPVAREAVEVAQRSFDPSSPKLAILLTNLADIYRTQARYAEAEPLYRRALDIFQKGYGPD